MSVNTPILTTSSEICAFATPLDAARANPAITVAANDFMSRLPGGFGLFYAAVLPGFAGAVYLKFLHRERRIRPQELQIENGTRVIDLPVLMTFRSWREVGATTV